DDTLNSLQKFKDSCEARFDITCQLIDLKKNQGKGRALQVGIEAAKSDWLLTLDGDAAFSPLMIKEWTENEWVDWSAQNTVYIGSRELGGKRGWVKFKWHRRIIGRIFSVIVRTFTGIQEADTQCGFKLYPKAIGKQAFSKLVDYGFAHDFEILFRLMRADVQIVSLPVRCIDRGDSKVNILTDSFRMLRHVIRIWWSRLRTKSKESNH
ncbi:MAG: glycosyltransferase, partial [Flavobacteriaceae bacterium]